MKKVLSILLTILMVICVFPAGITASATTSGTTGDCTWTLDGTVLTISGNGDMGNYSFPDIPWGTSITSVIIENGVTSIGNGAFRGCINLASITIPNSVTSVGGYAFLDCYSLTGVTIPNSVTSIGGYAFCSCTSLTSVTIPNSVTSIGTFAFNGCTSLTSITISNSVTSIGPLAFRYCPALAIITVEEGNIVYHSENNCLIETESKTLILGCKNSVIPSDGSVTNIGYEAFFNCERLTSVTIPNSVTIVEYGAFSNCDALTDVWYTGTLSEKNDILFEGANSAILNATWHYNTCNIDEHVYSADCDATCNICEWERNPISDHAYDNDYDKSCNGCGQTRETVTLFGDANGDGFVNVIDAMVIAQYTVGLIENLDLTTCDVNSNGEIDIADAMLIAQFEVGLISGFSIEK